VGWRRSVRTNPSRAARACPAVREEAVMRALVVGATIKSTRTAKASGVRRRIYAAIDAAAHDGYPSFKR
jgi:hypothetical protein